MNNVIDTRCGLRCEGCDFRESHHCKTCIESRGHPFHGECPIAVCCQSRGLTHCGECSEIPCKKLWQYSYTDPAHGDTPPGARVEQCRKWAADSGIHKWENVLLTDSAFGDWDFNLFAPLVDKFAQMLGKPFAEAKVLFIPSAEKNWQTAEHVEWCKKELLKMGILPQNITVYDLTYCMPESKAMDYDVLYFTGGSAKRLLKLLKSTGFDKIVKKMVYANKVYIGVSAGSLIAMPHLDMDVPPDAEETPGLCLVHAYFTVHCEPHTPHRTDLRLPHYAIGEGQAIAVNWAGYELIASHSLFMQNAATDDDDVETTAARILQKHRKAFEELAQ